MIENLFRKYTMEPWALRKERKKSKDQTVYHVFWESCVFPGRIHIWEKNIHIYIHTYRFVVTFTHILKKIPDKRLCLLFFHNLIKAIHLNPKFHHMTPQQKSSKSLPLVRESLRSKWWHRIPPLLSASPLTRASWRTSQLLLVPLPQPFSPGQPEWEMRQSHSQDWKAYELLSIAPWTKYILLPWTTRGCISDLSSATFLLAHNEVASWAFIHFLKHGEFLPISGLSHLLFLLPGKFWSSWLVPSLSSDTLRKTHSCLFSLQHPISLFASSIASSTTYICSFLIYLYDWYIPPFVWWYHFQLWAQS